MARRAHRHCRRSHFDGLGLPRRNILAYPLPASATFKGIQVKAWWLMTELGIAATEIDMTPACRQLLDDIGLPIAGGEP